jgi:hypothetical protein
MTSALGSAWTRITSLARFKGLIWYYEGETYSDRVILPTGRCPSFESVPERLVGARAATKDYLFRKKSRFDEKLSLSG